VSGRFRWPFRRPDDSPGQVLSDSDTTKQDFIKLLQEAEKIVDQDFTLLKEL
ncbi:unnamed protein product, partial [Rotaria magnacalcarata]